MERSRERGLVKMVLEPYKPYTNYEFAATLYKTLRACRPNYNANDYRWRLGVMVIDDIKRDNPFVYNPTEKRTLYGIVIEVDYQNPYNIQLFEDITNRIAIDKGANNE